MADRRFLRIRTFRHRITGSGSKRNLTCFQSDKSRYGRHRIIAVRMCNVLTMEGVRYGQRPGLRVCPFACILVFDIPQKNMISARHSTRRAKMICVGGREEHTQLIVFADHCHNGLQRYNMCRSQARTICRRRKRVPYKIRIRPTART